MLELNWALASLDRTRTQFLSILDVLTLKSPCVSHFPELIPQRC